MRRIARQLMPAATVVALLLTACAGPGASTAPIDHPTGDGLLVRIQYSGGFAGPMFDYLNFPPFSLLGNGRVIVPGAEDAIFPGPALPAVHERRLSEAGIQAVLSEVAGTALFGASVEFRGAQNCVADAPDTIFTLHSDGRDVTVRVYGLGTVDPANGCQGMSSSERAAHRTLQHLAERLATLESWLPASAWAERSWQPYRPDALRLVVRNADADPPDGSGLTNPLVDWPDSSDPATVGDPGPSEGQRCAVVSGQRAADWHAALAPANQLTRFVKDDHRYQVTVRLMLPDEPLTCPMRPD